MKNNILIIIYDYYPNPSANTLCVQKIINELVNNNYNIHVLCVKSNLKSKGLEIINNITVHRIFNMYDYFNRKILSLTKFSIIKRIIHKIFRIFFYFNIEGYLSKFYNFKTFKYACKIIDNNKVNKLITVSLPFITHKLGMKLKLKYKNIDWTAYELDPFTYNYILENKMRNKRSKVEIDTYKLTNRIISTDGIDDENTKYGFRQLYKDKTYSLPLPNLEINLNSGNYNFNVNKINLIYTGNFYGRFRNPEPLLRILEYINDDRLVFHIFGDGAENSVLKFKNISHNIILHERVDKKCCENIINSADLLINFGNDIPNQTPSKVFEYMGTGKPIINFYFDNNDTSLRYLKLYPLCLNIKNNQNLDNNLKDIFLLFCENNKNSRISRNELLKTLENILSINVCNNFMHIIENK